MTNEDDEREGKGVVAGPKGLWRYSKQDGDER